MPDPPGLVVKNGTNKFVGFMIPGPSSCTNTSTHSPASRQPTATLPLVSSEASTALCKMLISNCSICAASATIDDFRAWHEPHRQPCFQADHAPNEFAEIESFLLRRREAREPRICLHETAERFGARGDHVQSAARIVPPIRRRRIAPQQVFPDCRRST